MLSRIVVAPAVADHEREGHLELAARHVVSLGGEVVDLIETDPDEIDERDFHDGAHAGHRGPGRDADEAGLRDGRVDDARRAEFLCHAHRRTEHAAELGNVFTDDEHVGVLAHLAEHGLASGAGHGEGSFRTGGGGRYWLCHGLVLLQAYRRLSASVASGYSLSRPKRMASSTCPRTFASSDVISATEDTFSASSRSR